VKVHLPISSSKDQRSGLRLELELRSAVDEWTCIAKRMAAHNVGTWVNIFICLYEYVYGKRRGNHVMKLKVAARLNI